MKQSFEITGIIFLKNDEVQITEKFKKRTFVLSVPNSSYKDSTISFSLIQENCKLLDDFQKEDSVSLHFNIDGREWIKEDGESTFFNDLIVYRITKLENAISTPDLTGNGDDLPF